MPAGRGKSLCFQIPALAQEGICLVISPLIALMKDQVQKLNQRGIKATAIFSGMSKREIDITLDNCIYGNFKFLYLAPERLMTEIVLERIGKMKVNLIAVDEAHCISQWGYDFRPAYLKIAEIRSLFKDIPVIALTATATEDVQQDIQEKLLFKDGKEFKDSFERNNLSYSVFEVKDKKQKIIDIVQKVKGSGIIYTNSRKKTKTIAAYLLDHQISADFYHAGLEPAVRWQKQDSWINGQTRIIVATNAFGLGIDKPDVRLVIHEDLPDNLESYYQETGRAGRDSKKAYAVLLYNPSDINKLKERHRTKIPAIKEIKRTYQALSSYFQLAVGTGAGESFDFDIIKFCHIYNIEPITTTNALKILEQEGWLVLSEPVFMSSRLKIMVNKQELYQFENVEPLIKLLLRTYPGIFENYVNINETTLAGKLKINKEELIKSLQAIKNTGIVDYLIQKNKPQLTFVMPRAKSEDLNIDELSLKQRRTVYENKVKAILKYISNTTQYRSRFLLKYLGTLNIEQ